jgi:dTDP-4-dehydrorhamnose reductase
VLPVTTAERGRAYPAPRPAYSVLDNMALRLSALPALPEWQASLARLVPFVRSEIEREQAPV